MFAFFFPDVHSDIDWGRSYEFLEKELQQIAREAETGKRLADKLVKVWRKTGEQVWVLVHIEVQSQAKKAFAERMYTYSYRLRDRFRRPVASFAILSDDDSNWHPTGFSFNLWDCTVDFKFRTIKLLDYSQQKESLLASSNPFAVVVVAHLQDASNSSGCAQPKAVEANAHQAALSERISARRRRSSFPIHRLDISTTSRFGKKRLGRHSQLSGGIKNAIHDEL